jgi:hypothetical protein
VAGLCLCAAVVSFFVLREMASRASNAFKTEPGEVAEVSDGIAKFDIPPGYEVNMAMSFFNYDMVSIMPTPSASTEMTIMMMQFTGGAGADEEQMQEALRQQGNQPSVQMKIVEQRTGIIRGEEVPVTISESTASGSFTLRQWTAVFSGNKGPTILMIQGSTTDWDDDLIKDFIESIH